MRTCTISRNRGIFNKTQGDVDFIAAWLRRKAEKRIVPLTHRAHGNAHLFLRTWRAPPPAADSQDVLPSYFPAVAAAGARVPARKCAKSGQVPPAADSQAVLPSCVGGWGKGSHPGKKGPPCGLTEVCLCHRGRRAETWHASSMAVIRPWRGAGWGQWPYAGHQFFAPSQPWWAAGASVQEGSTFQNLQPSDLRQPGCTT